jgi:hypothetical protein
MNELRCHTVHDAATVSANSRHQQPVDSIHRPARGNATPPTIDGISQTADVITAASLLPSVRTDGCTTIRTAAYAASIAAVQPPEFDENLLAAATISSPTPNNQTVPATCDPVLDPID